MHFESIFISRKLEWEKSMTKKYIFVDLDGTLLNDEKKVCKRNENAIEKAVNYGHHVITATGRPLESANVGAKNAGLDKDGC